MTQEDNMKQEDKDLLLKYLCMALLYRMAIKDDYGDTFFLDYNDVHIQNYFEEILDGVVKPYLRPMSSMTEEEKEEMHNLLSPEGTAIYGCGGISMPMNNYGEFVSYEFMNNIIHYLLEHHFDFMGLIPQGLAIEVTEDNNPYKN